MKRFTKIGVAITVLIAGGQLAAQPSSAPAGKAAPAVSSANLTAAQMVARADVMASDVRAALQHVQHLQTLARQEKDVIKLTCVNDKYLELKAAANLFDGTAATFTNSLDTDDRTSAFDEASKAAAAVQTLKDAADTCVGKAELLTSETDSTSPDIVDDPTSTLPFDETTSVGIEQPGYASPFD